MTKVRVTSNIDEGYDFDVEHKNWQIELTWKERCLLFMYFFLPTIIINLAYIGFRDILIAQMLYQLTLVFLPLIYQQFFPLNLDILYIQYVKNIQGQMKSGFCWMIVYILIIPAVPIILKVATVDIFEDMKLFIPSGLTPESTFQLGVHILYFILLSVIFGIVAPIAEFRYYLVFLQSKFKDGVFTYIVLWIVFLMNSLVLVLMVQQATSFRFFILFLALVVLNKYTILRNKANEGIIVTLFRQFGINLGFIVLIILSIYTNFIIKKRKDISLFIDRNGIDLICDGFIWDDPNYDSSF